MHLMEVSDLSFAYQSMNPNCITFLSDNEISYIGMNFEARDRYTLKLYEGIGNFENPFFEFVCEMGFIFTPLSISK